MVDAEKATKRPGAIELVGPAGDVGAGQAGKPLHKPDCVVDRERVGAGGPLGGENEDGKSPATDVTHEIVDEERRRGEVAVSADPDQKGEILSR
jgi:hypothetical protein